VRLGVTHRHRRVRIFAQGRIMLISSIFRRVRARTKPKLKTLRKFGIREASAGSKTKTAEEKIRQGKTKHGVIAGTILGLSDGKGAGLVLSAMRKTAGLTPGETGATAITLLIPGAALILLDAVPRELVCFPGAAVMMLGDAAATRPGTKLRGAMHPSLPDLIFGGVMAIGGGYLVATSLPEVARDVENLAREDLALPSPPSAEKVVETVKGEIDGATSALKECASNVTSMPRLLRDESATQLETFTLRDAAGYALAGALRRSTSLIFGPPLGVFVAPVPLLTCLTDVEGERAALATACLALLPRAVHKLKGLVAGGTRPKIAATAPFVLGTVLVSTTASYVALSCKDEHLRFGIGTLMCLAGGVRVSLSARNNMV